MARDMGPGHTIVTILCDYGTRYQSKLFNAEFLASKGPADPAMDDRAGARPAASLRGMIRPSLASARPACSSARSGRRTGGNPPRRCGAQAVDYDAWEAEAERAENLLSGGHGLHLVFREPARHAGGLAHALPAAADTRRRAHRHARGRDRDAGPRARGWLARARRHRRAAREPQGSAGAGARPADQRRAAFTRADGLIGEIDELLRDRQQQQLLQLDPSPAQPGELGHGGGRAARSGRHDPEPDREPRRRPGAPGYAWRTMRRVSCFWS
jgi:hypothetical protein